MNPVSNKQEKYNLILTKYSKEEKSKLEEFFKQNKIDLDQKLYEITIEEIQLDYNNFSYAEIMKKLLGERLDDFPSGFEIIGKIAHLNLREKYLPYKNLIGRLILDVKIYQKIKLFIENPFNKDSN